MTNAEFNVTFGINVEDSSKSKRSKLSNTFKELKEEAEGYKDELEKALKVEEALLGMDLKKEAKKQGITFRGKNGKETAEWKKFKTDYNAALFTAGENVSNASSRISNNEKMQEEVYKRLQLVNREYAEEVGKNYETMRNIISRSFNGAKKVISSFVSFLKKMTSPITNFFKKLGKQTDVVKRIEKAFTSISHVFRYMILRMAFRQAIKNFNTFFGKLLEFSEKTADAFNVLYNAIVKLQVTVTAMVAPFIQAFGSILAGIVSKIIEFINYFNQLTSALFNNSETYIRAKDTALDYRDALDKTGKAANKVLAPFDQINQLGKAGGSGAGGLFDNLNPNDLFEEAPVDKSIKSLSDRIKEAFKDKTFFDGFDSFTFMSNLMNKLQSYLDTDTAATLGIFAGSFVNWIVRGIDGFITTWEPEGTANFLITFCEKFAEKLDATSLKNVAKTLLTKLATFFGTIASSLRDSNIGVDAGEWLNDILPAAADLSYSLGQLLGAAIGQVADFINTTDSQKLVDVIVAFVDGATENGELSKVASAIWKLLVAGIDALASSIDTMVKNDPAGAAKIGGMFGAIFLTEAVINAASLGMGVALKSMFTKAFTAGSAGAVAAEAGGGIGAGFFLKGLGDKIKTGSASLWTSTKSLASQIGTKLGEAWQATTSLASKIWAWICNAFSTVTSWVTGTAAGGISFGAIVGALVMGIFTAIASGLEKKWEESEINLTMSDSGVKISGDDAISKGMQEFLDNSEAFKNVYQVNRGQFKWEFAPDEEGNVVVFQNGEYITTTMVDQIDDLLDGVFQDYNYHGDTIKSVLPRTIEKAIADSKDELLGKVKASAELKDTGKEIGKTVASKAEEQLKDKGKDGLKEKEISGVKEASKKAKEEVKNTKDVQDVGKEVGTTITDNAKTEIENNTGKLTDSIKTAVSTAKNNLNEFQTFYTTFAGNIVSLTEQLANSLADGINNVGNSMVKMMGLAVDSMSKAVSAYNAAASAVGEEPIYYNATKPKWTALSTNNKFTIPKLATGAVLPANRPFLSVVGDQKHGTNVEAPLDTIKQALREVQVEGNTSRPTNLTIECDKRVLGKLFVDLGNEESRRVGSKFVTI